MRVGRGAYWVIGWLLTLVATYAGTQYARSRGLVAPVVPGAVAVVFGAVLCGIGLTLARRLVELPEPPGYVAGGLSGEEFVVTGTGPRVILLLESRADWRTGERRKSRAVFRK
jgi:hypothetical protein